MRIVTGWASDKGVERSENQDCCYSDAIDNPIESSAIAVLCDGMGGLSDGAVASRKICDSFKAWYDNAYNSKRPVHQSNDKQIVDQLTDVLLNVNNDILRYGKEKGIRIGTTASVLYMRNGKYYILHVGDSRVYYLSEVLKQITEDDSLAAVRMRRGEINQIEYESSKERHILTQCIGVRAKPQIHYYEGEYNQSDVFFLCSDGMYHNLKHHELSAVLMSQRKDKGSSIVVSIEKMIDKMISRGERDNITGLIMYVDS